MAFDGLLVTEIFHSLQGETSLSGFPFAFIRMTGCNLRCTYCDTSYSFKGGQRLRISEVLEKIRPYQVRHVLLTGGEPLLQRNVPALLDELIREKYQVSVETHGEVSIAEVSKKARIIMDLKTPSSGMCRGGFERNLPFLKPSDEVKFVIASKEDYVWARGLIPKIPTQEILFSAANPAPGAPGTFPGVETRWLAERILEDRLQVRLQVQLHKVLWGNLTGV
jgi:7-carboxy-7-deazaguanine synthase